MIFVKRSEVLEPEGFFHFAVHFVGVVLLFWIAVVPPVGISILLIVLEYLHMKALGNCISTVIAHKRGYMKGQSYWEYVPYVLGVKDYKTAKLVIDYTLKIVLVGIVVFRLLGSAGLV